MVQVSYQSIRSHAPFATGTSEGTEIECNRGSPDTSEHGKKVTTEGHSQVNRTKEEGTYHDMEGKELTERRRKEEGNEGRQCFGRQG